MDHHVHRIWLVSSLSSGPTQQVSPKYNRKRCDWVVTTQLKFFLVSNSSPSTQTIGKLSRWRHHHSSVIDYSTCYILWSPFVGIHSTFTQLWWRMAKKFKKCKTLWEQSLNWLDKIMSRSRTVSLQQLFSKMSEHRRTITIACLHRFFSLVTILQGVATPLFWRLAISKISC